MGLELLIRAATNSRCQGRSMPSHAKPWQATLRQGEEQAGATINGDRGGGSAEPAGARPAPTLL